MAVVQADVSATLDVAADPGTPVPWRMPRPSFGIVTWRHGDGSGAECYAVVTAVHPTMIDLLCFPNTWMQGQPKTGVKHISDPSLKRMSGPNPGGIFDLCPGELHMLEVVRGASNIMREQAEIIARLRGEVRRLSVYEGEFDGGAAGDGEGS